MFRIARELFRVDKRTYKNFGHKREPESKFTVIWHGFLTFGLIGVGIEWKKIVKYFLGDDADADITNPIE